MRGLLISVSALVTVWALLAPAGDQALAAGVAVAVLAATRRITRHAPAALPALAGCAPVASARERRATLAGRGTPRLCDPGAAGRTRSRAPSDGLPSRGVPA